MSEYVVAIPARYASTRLPGKPLCDVAGMPMIKRVCLQALQSKATKVIACVDDIRVENVLKDIDVTVCQTSLDCQCGTDRIAEMISILNLSPDTVVVNVQGDEPLIHPSLIDDVANLLINKNADMATLCAKIHNVKDVFDPNCVKVVMDKEGFALYFSRCPIPYERDNFGKGEVTALNYDHFHHIGIYAYKVKTIMDYHSRPQSMLEKSESLEQLRLLHFGMSIAVGVTDRPPEVGVDTADDLRRVNDILSR